jgi:hypothetical protein
MTRVASRPARLTGRSGLTAAADTGIHATPLDRGAPAPWSASDVQEVRP